MALKGKQRQQRSKRFKKFHFCETLEDPQLVPTLLREIIFEILTRLPVQSLLRCKSVCKSWCSLISDPYFIKSHLSLSARNSHYAHHQLVFTSVTRATLYTCPLYDVMHDNYVVNALDHGNPFDPHTYPWIIGSCNGLLCLWMRRDTMYIWNPATRIWNRLICDFRKGVCGFGYDKSTDDYKVVGIFRFGKAKSENRVKIYSLKTGIWKKIGKFPHGYPLHDSGKFLNGALHWAAGGPSIPWTIVSLDLADETYHKILQPMYDDEGDKDLTLGVMGECLCVLCSYVGNHVDVWVMKVYGVTDSWTKLVSIPYLIEPEPRSYRFPMPLLVSDDGKVLLQIEHLMVLYDSKNSSYFKIQNSDGSYKANMFVESLVSPCSPSRWNFRIRRIP